MPLDPLAKAFLDQLAASPRPKAWEVTPEEARAGFRAYLRPLGPKDVPIGKVENMTMPGPGGDLGLRIYTPVAAGGEALPSVVFFHGGAFRQGDFETHDAICRLLAGEGGCRVIAVDYRLAPENSFPAAIDDALAAVRWIETNAAQVGVDPNRIAVGGDSAGANLAAVVCHLAKAENAPHIACQLLMFPVVQFGGDFPSLGTFAQGFGLDRDSVEYCYELYAPREQWSDPRVSPLSFADMSGLPQAYVMLAECDPLHDEGLAYADKLRDVGVPVAIADWPGMIHDFIFYQAVLPQAREALVQAAKALRDMFDRI